MEVLRKWERFEPYSDPLQIFTPRTGHTVALSGEILYLFGGADQETRTNHLYEYNIKKRKWRKINNSIGQYQPQARSGAQSGSYQGSIYIFGGYTRKGGEYFNDICCFNIASQIWYAGMSKLIRRNLNPAGVTPSPRTDHTFLVHQNMFLMYGGRDETKIYSDLWLYHIERNEWEEIQISPGFGMTPRFGHTAVMHSSKMLIFGGWDGNQTLSDILEYNLVSNQWGQVEAKGTIKGRYRHSAASNDKAMYVFGGIDQQQERFNDIHEFMFGTSTWSRVITIGNTPSKRTFHQSVMYANAYFYVIGGFDGQKVNDMYRVKVCPVITEPQIQAMKEEVKVQEEPLKENAKRLTQEYFDSIPSYKWQKVQGTGKKYTPRTGHECLFYKDKIYLFGGMDDDDRRNDLFSFDIFTNHWDKMLAQGDVPSPRSGARGVAFNDFLYFFGGYSKQSAEYYEDLFRYDLTRRRWEALPDNGEKPSKRTDHSMVLYGSSFFVFGGYDGQNRFGDLYKCSLAKNFKWKLVKTQGESVPLNRFGHCAIVVQHSMIIFGGWNGHDTMDDLYYFSFASNTWYDIKRIKGIRPQPRYRHSAVEINNKMIIFGGVDVEQQRFNDVFSYDPEKHSWQVIQSQGDIQPQPRTFHRAVAFNNLMYILGGFDGTRLNDLHLIAFPKEPQPLLHQPRPISTSMQTVPSDQAIQQEEAFDETESSVNLSTYGGIEEEKKGYNPQTIKKLKKQIRLLKQQVKEVTQMLQSDQEASNDDCKICYSREINTVFLECAHRVMCSRCAKKSQIAFCPICRKDIVRIVKTFNV